MLPNALIVILSFVVLPYIHLKILVYATLITNQHNIHTCSQFRILSFVVLQYIHLNILIYATLITYQHTIHACSKFGSDTHHHYTGLLVCGKHGFKTQYRLPTQ